MKSKLPVYVPAILLMCLNLTGCELVKGIFKAGVWVGVIGVLAILGLVVFGLSKLVRR